MPSTSTNPPAKNAGSLARNVVVGMLGLALGLGGTLAAVALVRADDREGQRQEARPASVQRLELPGSPTGQQQGPQATGVGKSRPVAAGSAREAVQGFFQALARGDFDASYGLLDKTGRQRFSSPARWTEEQRQRQPVSGVKVGEALAVDGVKDASDITVELRHPASIDPFAGLVPGRTVEVWRAHREAGGWRVEADPRSAQPLLPGEAAAPDAVSAWR